MLLKDEFLDKWAEVSGFNFRKLLEDNQNLSLPMITLIDNTPVIFAFVYSVLYNVNDYDKVCFAVYILV